VLLAPREGPAGWRSVIATPEGGEIALWQQKVAADKEPSKLVEAARDGDGGAFSKLLVSHTAQRCTPTAIGCSARFTTPRTRC
jgi:hypothetical protein